MTTPFRCVLCGRTATGRGYVHASPMPEELARLSPGERDRRARGDGDLVLLDAGARGFQRAVLSLPIQHAPGEDHVRSIVWVELTKGAWRSLQSVEREGTSAEVAALVASRVPGVEGALGEPVRVRRHAGDTLPRVVAATRGKLARLQRAGSLSAGELSRIERTMADELAPSVIEAFLLARAGVAAARWTDGAPDAAAGAGEIACVRVDGAHVAYVTIGASATELRGAAGDARVELVLEARRADDARVPPLLLGLARRAVALGAPLVPGTRLEVAGIDLLSRGADRSFLWLAPSPLGGGSPIVAGPLHAHVLRALPLHADEDALLEREGPEALAHVLALGGLDPLDLGRPSALALRA